MNKLILNLILILFSAFQVQAQKYGSIGSKWYFDITSTAPPNSEYQYFWINSDTIINGITVKKIQSTSYKFNADTIHSEPKYIYEKNDTVFMYSSQKNIFLKFYIFNAQQGDTLVLDILENFSWLNDTTYKVVIDTIETRIVDGVTLKLFKTTTILDENIFKNKFYMERIGWLNWFYPEYLPTIPKSGEIRCYSDASIDTSFTDIQCDYGYNTELHLNVVNNRISISKPYNFYIKHRN